MLLESGGRNQGKGLQAEGLLGNMVNPFSDDDKNYLKGHLLRTEIKRTLAQGSFRQVCCVQQSQLSQFRNKQLATLAPMGEGAINTRKEAGAFHVTAPFAVRHGSKIKAPCRHPSL